MWKTCLQQRDACLGAGFAGGCVPDAGLHFANVGAAQQQHAQAALADAAAEMYSCAIRGKENVEWVEVSEEEAKNLVNRRLFISAYAEANNIEVTEEEYVNYVNEYSFPSSSFSVMFSR